MDPWVNEAIGYLASLLVAVSLMMRSVLRLRLINLAGSACFTLYGLLIQSYPVAGMNAFIVAINVYYLARMLRARAAFTVVAVRHDADYLRLFLERYRDDMLRFFPPVSLAPAAKHYVYLVVRDMLPVGLVIAEREHPDTMLVHVDYVIPGYRDLQPGRYFYDRYAAQLRAEGITTICTAPGPPQHRAYLEKVGFVPAPTPSGETRYCRALGVESQPGAPRG